MPPTPPPIRSKPIRIANKAPTTTSVQGGKIYTGDCEDLLDSLPDESVDLCIIDPAYESLERHRALGSTTRLKHSKSSSNDWFQTFPNARYTMLFQKLFRVMKNGTHIYIFCDEETRDIITIGWSPINPNARPLPFSPLLHAGFKYWKSIIWNKVVPGMGYHYRVQHEFIIMAEKVLRANKHKQLNDHVLGDVFSIKRLKGPDYYPTEKPLAVVEPLVLNSSKEGDTVLDFFCGSGVVGEACKRHNRNFILGDVDTKEALSRLKNEHSKNHIQFFH
jgi:site-specific DNA-methyltransferase (adenine-specific)